MIQARIRAGYFRAVCGRRALTQQDVRTVIHPYKKVCEKLPVQCSIRSLGSCERTCGAAL
jgi:hypothetical protein